MDNESLHKYMAIEGIEVAGKFTTIKVSTETRDELSQLAFMNDSYDSVIKKLVKYYKENVQK